MHVSQLGEELSSSDRETRHKAAELLSQQTEAAAEVSADLVRHAGDDDRVVAEYCVAALEESGPPPDRQVAELATLARSDRPDVAYWAATLLGRAGAVAAPHAPVLGEVVSGGADDAVRERAAWALGRVGPAAAAAVPHLKAAADQPHLPPSLARTVKKALELIGR